MTSTRTKKYEPKDLTDDEDSDIEHFTDDSRSRMKRHEVRAGRQRRLSEQFDLDHRDTEVINRIQRMKEKSKYIRERRSGSLTNFPTTRDRDSGSMTPSDDDLRKISTKFRKASLISPTPQSKNILSDSASEKRMIAKETIKPKSPSSKSFQTELIDKPITTVKSNVNRLPSESASEQEVTIESSKPIVSKPLTNPRQTELDEAINIKPVALMTQIKEKKLISENRSPKISSANQTTKNNPPEIAEKSNATPPEPSSSIKNEIKIGSDNPSTSNQNCQFETQQICANAAWECEHCTFVNDPCEKICSICCKTRVEVLEQLPKSEDPDIDINEFNDSISENDNDAKQKGKIRKISFLPGTKAH